MFLLVSPWKNKTDALKYCQILSALHNRFFLFFPGHLKLASGALIGVHVSREHFKAQTHFLWRAYTDSCVLAMHSSVSVSAGPFSGTNIYLAGKTFKCVCVCVCVYFSCTNCHGQLVPLLHSHRISPLFPNQSLLLYLLLPFVPSSHCSI